MLTVLGSARHGQTSIALPPCSATTMADPSPPLSLVAPDDISSFTPSATALERRQALDVEMQHRALGCGRPRAATAASLQHKCVPPPAPNHHLASKHADDLVCCRPMVSLTAVSRGDYSSSKRTGAVSGSSCPSSPGHSDPWCFDVSGQSHASGFADDGYVVDRLCQTPGGRRKHARLLRSGHHDLARSYPGGHAPGSGRSSRACDVSPGQRTAKGARADVDVASIQRLGPGARALDRWRHGLVGVFCLGRWA
jgi:hypothetical protein